MSEDRRKELCRELAERLATPEGLRTTRLLQAAGLLAAPPPEEAPRPLGRRGPEPISVWEPREDADGGRVFVRPEPSPLGDHFAAVRELRPKQSELPLRVALFGESVAAGYLYAPHLTPAQVLEAQLRAAGGEGNFEVVDLARTNETLASLAETVRTSLQINPDVLVLFAGNNWNLLETPEISPYAPSVAARQRYAEALRDGVAGPLRLAESRLRDAAEAVLDRIALIARAVGIPVVVVLPEVNLADWQSRQPPVWLPGDGTARWHELYGRATELLASGDFESALNVAGELRGLDGGACAATWRLAVRARQGLGDAEGALQAAVAEVDAAAYATQAFLDSPRATTAARGLLRGAARRHGFVPVDLRETFRAHTGDALPGRRMFLDYCHLTSEGMAVAMAAVAARVLDLSGMVEGQVAPGLLLSSAPGAAPAAEATARLGAAVHSAHRLLTVDDRRPLLESWCESALDASPGAADALLDLTEIRCTPVPAVLTAAQRRNLASPYRLTLQHGLRWEHLDADLLQAIEAVLERRGIAARERIARWLVDHHGLRPEGTDLTQPPYLWEPLERFYPEVMRFEDLSERATHRSPWLETSFCLVADGDRDIEVEPTLRLPAAVPGGRREGRVEVAVNGSPVGGLDAAERWRRATIPIPRDLLRPGLNRLTLRWPMPAEDGAEALCAARERLELGLAADLHPVFGEVFSLLARPR